MPNPTVGGSDIAIPEKERYTYLDYRELPEGAPYELIGGHLLMSPAPSPQHQIVQANLFFALSTFVRQHELGRVLSAPVDVRLSESDVLQPDLVFISEANRNLIGDRDIEGAPDLICEVLSSSTAHRDLTQKKRLYEEHGVAEYWIVDPDQEVVEIYQNTEDGFVQHARVVEHGSVESALLDGLTIDPEELF